MNILKTILNENPTRKAVGQHVARFSVVYLNVFSARKVETPAKPVMHLHTGCLNTNLIQSTLKRNRYSMPEFGPNNSNLLVSTAKAVRVNIGTYSKPILATVL